ncbi:MAG: GNAT family N-acetyltransferase [Microthrixaceae bacterium]
MNGKVQVVSRALLRHTHPVTFSQAPTHSPLRMEIRYRLDSLAPAWDELLEQQEFSSPFLSSCWVDQAAEGTPALMCFFNGSVLVGGAAFQVDSVGKGPLTIQRVRCVGQGTLAPDHLDLISKPEFLAEVRAAVIGWFKRPGSRVIDLDGLAATGALATALRSHEISRMTAPYSNLPEEGSEYLAQRPGQVRSTIVRTRKRFARDGVEFRQVPPESMPLALDRLAELHDGRWAEQSAFLEGWDRFKAAALAGAASGSFLIHELVTAEQQVIATELDLRCGNRLFFYQAGRKTEREWRGCGSVLRADILDWACAEGLQEYDLLRGDESYKADWSTSQRELVRCRLGIGPRGVAVIRAAQAQQHVLAWSSRIRSAVSERGQSAVQPD